MEKEYRVRPGRENRALAGLSLGGGQALVVGLRNPDRFAWLAAFSAGGAHPDMVSYFLDQHPPRAADRPRLLWVACGKEDSLYKENRSMVAVLEKHGLRPVAHFSEGAHSWPVWRDYLAALAPLLFREPPAKK